MGDLSHFRGSVTIDPPLDWAEIRRVQELPHIKGGYEIRLVVNEEQEDTDTGTVTVKTCAEIVPWTYGEYKGYYVQEALQEAMDACPGHVFSGYIEGLLPHAFQMWRIVANGAVAQKVDPIVTWPDA